MIGADGQRGRFQDSRSAWVRSFDLSPIKCLVVCRGPVRKEAFDVFDEIGVGEYGMLLSEKDSVTYARCLAPELRSLRFPGNVHRVSDYMGQGQQEKQQRIREIIEIARLQRYTHVFAGYGFMAEDAEFIEALEQAGIGFMGPCSSVVRRAGAKDEAKKLARRLGNAVIPGVDNVSALALLAEHPDRKRLEKLASRQRLAFRFDASLPLEENAEALLQAGYSANRELVTIEALQAQAERCCQEIWHQYPKNRIRFKHIAGGGGKGQRVVAKPDEVAAAVMDVLAEVKVLAAGSNRNFLIELNLESTRHNEIQLIGNGRWCLSMGGRDCSVQMHEQKLLEVSLTRELLIAEALASSGRTREILSRDQMTLQRMEDEACRFGEATGLDSVSTFECIVEGGNHFFMEMNTRIQVEHGVSELVYDLEFTSPDEPGDVFVVDRLIEAMALLALHGERVPKPVRRPRASSGLELRINATNQALQPHAGGLIRGWSAPVPGEIRFDQGIGARNPDTGSFVYYALAGAYDSNVALVLCDGASRTANYERMAEILRRMELRGDDLETNTPVHYGLVNWFLGKGSMTLPDTRFMQSYLAAVGSLQRCIDDLDLEIAVEELAARLPDDAARKLLAAKQTLLVRPLLRLLDNPHLLAGFLGRFEGRLWQPDADGLVGFSENPIRLLAELYHYLHMERDPRTPPSERIWDHDDEILQAGLAFYAEVESRTGSRTFRELEQLFGGSRDDRLVNGDEALWRQCVAAHRGHQLGLAILLLIPRLGSASGFCDVSVDAELRVHFPEPFLNKDEMAACTRALAPPPLASADEIVTPMGGAFYAREAPHLPPLVEVGQHFEAGQPLFIIEVMKMFNKILAPFAGTVTEKLMADKDGTVVSKGQTIFRIDPDERVEAEPPEALAERRRRSTLALI